MYFFSYTELKYLRVIHEISLVKNELGEIG